jgi:predicted Rdx family selenoprotein
VKPNSGAQYEISIDGVPRTYRDRQDIALQTARLLKSRNPNCVVKMRDLRTGEETVVAFKSGSLN